MAQYNLGTLTSSVISRNGYTVTPTLPTDVFRFNIIGPRDINLYLHNISAADDADLRLYRDNGDGIFTAADTLVASSLNVGNASDTIGYAATTGTYFAQVSRYAPGSTGPVSYDIDLSSTYNVGPVSGSVISRNGYTATAADSTDVFEFTLNGARDINLYLHNISAGDDADLRLYRDSNINGVWDADDTLVRSSLRAGNADDVISFAGTAGTYFAQVSRYASGSVGNVSYDLDLSSSYNVGTVGAAPIGRDNYVVSAADPTDVFEFNLAAASNLNLNLHDISAGDDVDLRLYRDYNSNGIFDATDVQFGLVGSSSRGSNFDDSINQRVGAGTYFAQVSRFSGAGNAVYDLDFSATSPSNLLTNEISVGDLNGDRLLSNAVGNTDTSDIYAFSLGFFEGVNISITGLTSDADIRLIQDSNNNRRVDAGEVLRSSTLGGNASDTISNFDLSGSYFLQVYQFSGNTSYNVNFDHYATVAA